MDDRFFTIPLISLPSVQLKAWVWFSLWDAEFFGPVLFKLGINNTTAEKHAIVVLNIAVCLPKTNYASS